MKAIVTIPPYAPFIRDVINHPVVEGVRLNTVMPVKESLEDLLTRLHNTAQDAGKKLYVDLKGRQLRVQGYWTPPYTEVEISHSITVPTPTTAYFGDGTELATLVGIEGNKLLFLEGPQRVVGPGEAINIPNPLLHINGYLTETDKAYLTAGQKVGITDYMLSFVESPTDISDARAIAPDANYTAKIESQKGLQYVAKNWKDEKNVRLMTARGDLYTEVRRPHEIIRATKSIVDTDKNAICASRILDSLGHSLEPSCADLGDLDSLMRMGYQTVMLGDQVCLRKESVMSALNIIEAQSAQYKAELKAA